MQDSFADINCINFCCAALKQAVGEAAGRSADIGTGQTFYINFECFKRGIQFFAAARDKARTGVNRQRWNQVQSRQPL